MKAIVLCADDYGQETSISNAILALIEKSRLSATSCLSTASSWALDGARLKTFQDTVDVGLHFNLTEGRALSSAYINAYGSDFFSLPTLMRRSFFRQLDQQVIRAECVAQLTAFSDVMGRLPDFLDGHQHVHQFPVVREVVIQVYEQYLRKNGSYIRSVDRPYRLTALKEMMIQAMGARLFLNQLISRHIPHNQSFSGIYSFKGDYASHFRKFLQEVDRGGLIMCHPGLSDASTNDAIASARYAEYLFLNSELCTEALLSAGVSITRFRAV